MEMVHVLKQIWYALMKRFSKATFLDPQMPLRYSPSSYGVQSGQGNADISFVSKELCFMNITYIILISRLGSTYVQVGDMVPLGFHYLKWHGWKGWGVVMYKGYWCCRVCIFLSALSILRSWNVIHITLQQ